MTNVENFQWQGPRADIFADALVQFLLMILELESHGLVGKMHDDQWIHTNYLEETDIFRLDCRGAMTWKSFRTWCSREHIFLTKHLPVRWALLFALDGKRSTFIFRKYNFVDLLNLIQ